MSFMFRDRKNTEFDYSNAPEPSYTKSQLEEEISIMRGLVLETEERASRYRRELELYRAALSQGFYKAG